jgi:hypothetical protein
MTTINRDFKQPLPSFLQRQQTHEYKVPNHQLGTVLPV